MGIMDSRERPSLRYFSYLVLLKIFVSDNQNIDQEASREH